jgi:hypothetical protein
MFDRWGAATSTRMETVPYRRLPSGNLPREGREEEPTLTDIGQEHGEGADREADDLVARRERRLHEAEDRHGAHTPEWVAAKDQLLEAVNALAAARGDLYLEPVVLNHRRSPNDPALLLLQGAQTHLYLEPFDPDQGPIVLTFEQCHSATFSPPNDENLRLSPLHPLGFGWWASVIVRNSPWTALFPWRTSDNLLHYALLLKDHCFHALAANIRESRIERQDFSAATRALADVPWHLLDADDRGLPRHVAF